MVERVARRSTLDAIAAPVSSRRRSSLVLGVEAVDDAGALDRDAGLGGQPRGKRLVGLGEAPRVPPLDGAEKADDLVAGDDRHVHDGALAAGDHLGALLGGELEIVVVRRRDATLGGGSGACADVAQSVDRPALFDGVVVGRLVAGDDLDRARRLLADEHVAVLDLEALGEALRDVDERAFGRPAPGAAALSGVLRRRLPGSAGGRYLAKVCESAIAWATTAQTPWASTSSAVV